jgi:hypothetical protein
MKKLCINVLRRKCKQQKKKDNKATKKIPHLLPKKKVTAIRSVPCEQEG